MSKKNGAARPTRTRTALGRPRRRTATPPTPAVLTPAPARPPAPPSHEQIAQRAYDLHRSGAEGDALAHWLAAERELVAN
jgi:Protein of unknown function (DUF2934)